MEEEVELQKDYYELFKMELEMEKVNPVVYWIKLVLGLLSFILSVMIWVQMYSSPYAVYCLSSCFPLKKATAVLSSTISSFF
jgi:hypothetical protein